jgi:hypothetical protein
MFGTALRLIACSDLLAMNTDIDRMSSNQGLFYSTLHELRNKHCGLLALSYTQHPDSDCTTTQPFVLIPGERSFMLKKLVCEEMLIPLPDTADSLLSNPSEAITVMPAGAISLSAYR